jgi:hypothetical protein
MSKKGKVDVDGILGAIGVGHEEMALRQVAAEATPRPGRPKVLAVAKEPLFVRVPSDLLQALDMEIVRRRAAQGRGSVTLGGLVEELLRVGLKSSNA